VEVSSGTRLALRDTATGRSRRRRLLRAASLVVLLTATAVALTGSVLFQSLPGVADAPARVAAILRSRGGVFVRLSPRSRVARATVAVEDRRFFEHGAIDPVALGRVVVDSVLHPGVDSGGSTIAQQLAKVLYHEPATFLGRLKAVGLAFKLEHRYPKARILSMYLNAIYYGHGFWGVGRASVGYFGRPASKLSWAQAALIAGIPQAPSLLDPFKHPAAALARRQVVLRELVRTGALTAAAAREAVVRSERERGTATARVSAEHPGDRLAVTRRTGHAGERGLRGVRQGRP
jgi:membrane peptidoglycan carboxypeptidase